MMPADPHQNLAPGDPAPLLAALPPAVAVDAEALRRWLLATTDEGGCGLPGSWQPCPEDVFDLVSELEAAGGGDAAQAWRLSPALTQTFVIRLHNRYWLFGADTAHGGRVCALPVREADLRVHVPGAGVDAAVAAVTWLAAVIDSAWRRTVSTLWMVSEPATTGAGLSGWQSYELLGRLAGLPIDDLAVPGGWAAAMSYNALRAGALVRDFVARPSPGVESYGAYRAWRDEVGGDPVLAGDVLRRFPNTAIAVLVAWIRHDEQTRLQATEGRR